MISSATASSGAANNDACGLPLTSNSPAARHERFQLSAAVFIAALALYLFCLPPSITRGGDCGELVSASYLLGIAHPTGYPLYCLLGRLWALVFPFGEVAFRYSVFSALCAAAACAVVTATVHRLTFAPDSRRGLWASGGAGLLLAGFYYLGSQAIIAEVYALNGLLLSLLWLCAVAWHQDEDWRWFYSLAALSGLIFVTHLSGIFVIPGLFVMAVWHQRARFSPKTGSKTGSETGALRRLLPALALAGAVCGLSLYLPLRSRLFPAPPRAQPIEKAVWWPLDWGHPSDFAAFKAHSTGQQYRHLLIEPGQFRLAQPIAKLPARLGMWLGFVLLQYLWLTPLVIVGAVAAFRERALGWALVLGFGLNLGIELNYNVSDQSNFFFPAYIVMAIWMGLGLETLARATLRAPENWRWRLRTGAILSLLATIFIQWTLFGGAVSLRGSTVVRDAARAQAEAVEQFQKRTGRPATVFLFNDETLWAFWYVRFVEKRAAGVWTPYGRGTHDTIEKGALPAYVAALQKRGPVFFGQWHEATDARFPFVLANQSGNLCLASPRALPPAATIRPASRAEMIGNPKLNGLQGAGFRRGKLWKADENGAPQLLNGGLAAFELDFRLKKGFLAADFPKAPRDEPNAARLAGTLEVLLVSPEQSGKTPSPTQKTVRISTEEDATALILHQRRRLVVPLSAAPGQILRATVPIEISNTLAAGIYVVWVRLLPLRGGENTPWTHVERVHVIFK